MRSSLSLLTRILIQLLLMRPDVLTLTVTTWESDDDYLSENNDAIRLQLRKDFLEQLLRKS